MPNRPRPEIDRSNDHRTELQRYRAEAESCRAEGAALRHQIDRLSAELADSYWVVPSLKRFFKALDAAARTRIERLNTLDPHISAEAFAFDPTADRAALMRSARVHDIARYYTTSAVRPRVAYKVVLRVYDACYSLARRLGIMALTLLQKMARR